ncbi:MAG: 16S rRNA (guanine(527)-N(7))-methyltransferase RsmG [Bacteroidota bacterium]|nr:16S rRNA (guanine(527)-N(7))-methyltransferase RsmG [Bacteroidota bacterium]MDP4273259.1 16S rRNA (guanine(527)-N(7))-methyltransferase RsmG [Bacteroidota bacterium]
MQIIQKYFPNLTDKQIYQFGLLFDLYQYWNERINVISRKDIENLYEHHVLHSLAIARVIEFAEGASILDVGTGGGFPGIPLAILFPEAKFTLVDSIGKKIKVVQAVAGGIGLSNCKPVQARAESLNEKFDFVVSRAVSTLPEFVKLVNNKINRGGKHLLPNGILYLKGGDVADEVKPYKNKVKIFDISNFFTEPFFETKKVIYLPF